MSKYYKAEDVETLITACEWRMTLAKERHGEGFVDYSKQVLDVDELTKRLSDLPTIEVSEDCISRKWLEENKQVVSYTNEWGETEINEYICWEDVENAPSVVPTVRKNRQVERAEGEWIDCDSDSNIYDDIRCSICGMKFTVDIERKTDIGFTITDLKFCPNCGCAMTNRPSGAKMKG